jgi:uncharacterized protein involved in response to NO
MASRWRPALFRVAFLVMLERTLTQFMKGVFQVEILRHAALDRAIKLLGLVAGGAPWLPPPLAGGLAAAAGAAAGHPLRCSGIPAGLRRLDIGIMYLGYAAIVLQLLLEAWRWWRRRPGSAPCPRTSSASA